MKNGKSINLPNKFYCLLIKFNKKVAEEVNALLNDLDLSRDSLKIYKIMNKAIRPGIELKNYIYGTRENHRKLKELGIRF